MIARSLTVRVTADAPPHATFSSVPALVALRDASLMKMKSTLAIEWKNATRGLGGLQVVEQSSDITIFVVAAHGTPVHRQGPDDSQDVIVFVEDALGQQSVENNVAAALHELGHIWCCYGPGTYPSPEKERGHWLTNELSPGLYGVDKFGLMTDPVTCIPFGSILSCPNRFSDREMRALGFTTFPPPAPDPCITQSLSLKAQVTTLDSQLATLNPRIESAKGTLTSLESRIRSIEAQYGFQLPPAVFSTYQNLVSQYNALNSQTNFQIDQYNGLLAQRRALASQYNGLPCDSS